MEDPGLKTTPGGLKVSIFTSAGLLRRAPSQNKHRVSKSIDFDVSGLALEGPGLKTSPGSLKVYIDFDVSGLALEGPHQKRKLYIYIYTPGPGESGISP